MQETSNYKLNKWDASDRIMMKDFNDDNQAIEEALTAHDEALENVSKRMETVQGGIVFHHLADWEVSTAANSITLDLTGYSTQYRRLFLFFDITPSTSNTDIRYRLNGNTEEQGSIADSDSVWRSGKLELFPHGTNGYTAGLGICAYDSGSAVYSSTLSFRSASTAYAQLTSIQIYLTATAGKLKAGCTFHLYGLK